MSPRALCRIVPFGLAPLLGPSQAIASPPFVLDDGDVEEVGHVELDLGPLAVLGRHSSSGELPYAEADLGVAPGIEADVVAPLAFATAPGHGLSLGPGDVELEAKARILRQTASGAGPSVALDPTLLLPTGSAARGLGHRQPELFLPVWCSRDLGRWDVFGGGGPTIGHDAGGRDTLLFGAGALTEPTHGWHLGAEIVETTRADAHDPGLLSIDLDAVRDLSARLHLFASVGRGAGPGGALDRATVFAGLQLTE